MGQEDYLAGANLALRAFGMADQMQQRQMMQRLQEAQMGQMGFQTQLIQAQIKAMEDKTRQLATLEGERKAVMPKIAEALTPETRHLTIPGGYEPDVGAIPGRMEEPMTFSQRMPLGRGNIERAMELLVGTGDPELFQKMAPGITGLMPKEWKPTTMEEAVEYKLAGQTPPTSEAFILSLPEDDPRRTSYLAGKERLGEKTERTRGGDFKVVEDKTSPTGYSYQHVADPTKIVKGAPAPKEPFSLDDFYRKQIVSKTLTEIPGLKKDAITQSGNIERINTALNMVERGVTGKGGQLKAFLAPWAEMAGINVEGWTEAQSFQLLTRAIIGPMRLDIVGPGPVSEWEQKLMQQISGGGGAAKEAAKELLSFWKKKAEDKIDLYNNTLTGLQTLMPEASTIHKPVTIKPMQTETIPTGIPKIPETKTIGGKTYEKIDGKWYEK